MNPIAAFIVSCIFFLSLGILFGSMHLPLHPREVILTAVALSLSLVIGIYIGVELSKP